MWLIVVLLSVLNSEICCMYLMAQSFVGINCVRASCEKLKMHWIFNHTSCELYTKIKMQQSRIRMPYVFPYHEAFRPFWIVRIEVFEGILWSKDGAKGTRTRLDPARHDRRHFVNIYRRFCPTPSPTYINRRQWNDFVDKTKPSRGDREKCV